MYKVIHGIPTHITYTGFFWNIARHKHDKSTVEILINSKFYAKMLSLSDAILCSLYRTLDNMKMYCIH